MLDWILMMKFPEIENTHSLSEDVDILYVLQWLQINYTPSTAF